MRKLRCPECDLALFLEDDEPTDLLACPGCGTMFQWEKASRRYTVFYDEAEEKRKEARAEWSQQQEGDEIGTNPEGILPAEPITNVSENLDTKLRTGRGHDVWTFFLIFLLATSFFLLYGIRVRMIDANEIGWRILLGILLPSFSIGLIVAVFVAKLIKGAELLLCVIGKVFGKQPDYDEIAKSLNRPIIRRQPLPTTGSSPRSSEGTADSSGITIECLLPNDERRNPESAKPDDGVTRHRH